MEQSRVFETGSVGLVEMQLLFFLRLTDKQIYNISFALGLIFILLIIQIIRN